MRSSSAPLPETSPAPAGGTRGAGREVARARPLLGTFVEIRAAGGPRDRLLEAIDQAFEAVARVHRLMNAHDGSSELRRLEHAPLDEPIAVDPWTWAVLAEARRLFEASGGLFDPAAAVPVSGRAQGSAGSLDDLVLEPDHRVRLGRRLRLDLSGIAKGFAVDRAVEVLAARGLDDVVVNAGGDLRLGCARGETIFVRHPTDSGRGALRLELAPGAALASSSPVFHRRDRPRRRLHLVDPRGRRAVDHGQGATVIASRCDLADALTKVVLLDPLAGARLAAAEGAAAFLLDPSGSVRLLEPAPMKAVP